MPYVYSTLSNDQDYAVYVKAPNGVHVKEGNVYVHGKANVQGKNLVTPKGVATSVTDEQLELLMANPVFKIHMDKGHISVSSKEVDANKVAADLTKKDKSAQATAADFGAVKSSSNKSAQE